MSITNGNDLITLADNIGLELPCVITLPTIDDADEYNNILINNDFHWTALMIRGKKAYYNDSYGRDPPPTVVKYVQKRGCIVFQFGNKQIQDDTSQDCGWFTIHFFSFMQRYRYNFMWYFNQFPSKRLEDNDRVLVKYFRKLQETHPFHYNRSNYDH